MGRRVSKREKIAFASVDSLVETKWAWKVSLAPPNPPPAPPGCAGCAGRAAGAGTGGAGGGGPAWGGSCAGRGSHQFLKPGLTFPSPPPQPPLLLLMSFGSTVCVSVRYVACVLFCMCVWMIFLENCLLNIL